MQTKQEQNPLEKHTYLPACIKYPKLIGYPPILVARRYGRHLVF
jgi:hypothetical protein